MQSFDQKRDSLFKTYWNYSQNFIGPHQRSVFEKSKLDRLVFRTVKLKQDLFVSELPIRKGVNIILDRFEIGYRSKIELQIRSYRKTRNENWNVSYQKG